MKPATEYRKYESMTPDDAHKFLGFLRQQIRVHLSVIEKNDPSVPMHSRLVADVQFNIEAIGHCRDIAHDLGSVLSTIEREQEQARYKTLSEERAKDRRLKREERAQRIAAREADKQRLGAT